MNPEEYANLERVEADHWYYAGKRELVRRWLRRMGRPRTADILLDCGAGTGRFAVEMSARCRVLALDDHEESLVLLRRKLGTGQVLALGPGAYRCPIVPWIWSRRWMFWSTFPMTPPRWPGCIGC